MHHVRHFLSPAFLIIAVLAVGVAIGWQLAPGAPATHGTRSRSAALQVRDASAQARDAAWQQGRKQGLTEAAFMAQYKMLRAQAQRDAVKPSTR